MAFAGAALVSVWASLRFGDASHVRWSSLLDDVSCHVVRGVAYGTKTTRRGMPFACQGRGIYGYWAATWFRSLDRLWPTLTAFSFPLMRPAMALEVLTWPSRRPPMLPPFAPCARRSTACAPGAPETGARALPHSMRETRHSLLWPFRPRFCPALAMAGAQLWHSIGAASSL